MATFLNPAPADPVGTPPARRPGSVRRTSTVLMSWPAGPSAELHLKGRARDLVTPLVGEPRVIAAANLYAVSGRERDIQRIESNPAVPGLERLIGCRAGGNLRASIAAELPGEMENGTPLHLLLDDLAGSTLISGFTLILWGEVFPEIGERMKVGAGTRVMRDVCAGFRDGSAAIKPDGTMAGLHQNTTPTGRIDDPTDPLSWHELDDHSGMAMRRARRIDVWYDGGELRIDSMFRDSVWNPEGQEVVLHEYEIFAAADRASGTLDSVTAVPRVLPYAECPGAAPNASWMAGTDLRTMRGEVLQRLRNADCCTHLNDGLRALAEVPVLATALRD
ncbi:MAG TPA: DUF2889 domain-containing protein [Acidimicrobiales bacterium]